MTLVADTAPLVTLFARRDPRMPEVARTLRQEVGEIILPAPIVAEVDYLAGARRFGPRRVLTFDERHFRTLRPLDGGAFTLLPSDELRPAR